jgi:hypothetical protein
MDHVAALAGEPAGRLGRRIEPGTGQLGQLGGAESGRLDDAESGRLGGAESGSWAGSLRV